MKSLDIYISHSKKLDYKNKLYTPLLNSKIAKENDLILPRSPQYNSLDTSEILKNCDLVIAEVTIQSIGVGIEIGKAVCLGIPVLFLLKKGEKLSSSVKHIEADIIEYSDDKELIYKLTNYLKENF